ncbi:hypothetical protein HUK80_01795 [Flavobacterium sp. MAH-1]|uniref:Uncharacterized protein n=1 Tax=Flavobacterium agri TaxID=2743471 RepID=A0A7Y8XZJ3_9FLAO|nr:hypothetical protein [Flavobacterium agri]NUY79612.1 hypothetical protein [Flavobacterium agri]NYA69637.1 hypothetical protein [Flavobacterium agri]
MKSLFKNKVLPFAAIAMCLSCSSRSQQLTEISCASGGGELGIYVTLRVTRDSLITQYRDAPKKLDFIEKNKSGLWDSLTKNITVADLKTLKSNKSTAYIDDPDEFLTVKTTEGDLSFINIKTEEIKDKRLLEFVEILQGKQTEIYEKHR